MSGGSYDYAFSKIEDMADNLRLTSPLRKAFKKHLQLVAKACHDIEWVDSCDCSPGDEDAAIIKCLGKDKDALLLKEVLHAAKHAQSELQKVIWGAENTAQIPPQ